MLVVKIEVLALDSLVLLSVKNSVEDFLIDVLHGQHIVLVKVPAVLDQDLLKVKTLTKTVVGVLRKVFGLVVFFPGQIDNDCSVGPKDLGKLFCLPDSDVV